MPIEKIKMPQKFYTVPINLKQNYQNPKSVPNTKKMKSLFKQNGCAFIAILTRPQLAMNAPNQCKMPMAEGETILG